MVMNSLCFCLSEKVLIPLAFLKESFARYRILGWLFSFLSILSMSSHSLLAWKVSVEKSVKNLMKIPLYVTPLFSLAALKNLSLSLTFHNLIIVSWFRSIQFQPFWSPLGLLGLDVHFSTQVQEVFSHCCFKYTFFPFLSLISFWNSHNENLFLFIVSHNSCRLSSLIFIVFSLFLWLGNFHCLFLQVSKSFFCMIESTFETLYWILGFNCCIFQLRISGLVFFFSGCYFLDELLILLVYCFPNFI